MKKLFVLFALCALSVNTHAQQKVLTEDISDKQKISELEERQKQMEQDVKELTRSNRESILCIDRLDSTCHELLKRLDSLQTAYNLLGRNQQADKNELVTQIGKANDKVESANRELSKHLDSLQTANDILARNQKTDKDELVILISETNDKVHTNEETLHSRTNWGITVIFSLLIVIGIITWWFFKKTKRSSTSIDEVRKAQDALQNAQTKMQEESIKLDNKLLEIAEQQMKIPATTNNQGTASVDHSLALKVADEIVRIELNLSRMDTSIKGYRQLSKAVQRIKDNFSANGYEIVDMLGKPYNDGMKVIANFVSDETLEQGKQIITGIIKPQINYNGKMIQSAQITVSQNI